MPSKNATTRARRVLPTQLIWSFALILCAGAALEAVGLAVFSSMKSARVQVLLSDTRAGTRSPQEPGISAALTPSVTRALLMQYVRARETFDETDIRQNYANVIAWSGPQAANEYRRLMARTNPESPLSQYPTRTTVSTRLKSISFLSDDAALIRFDVLRQDGGNRPAEPTPYTSVVSFGFASRANKSVEVNPLGFRVTKYTRTADANDLAALANGRR